MPQLRQRSRGQEKRLQPQEKMLRRTALRLLRLRGSLLQLVLSRRRAQQLRQLSGGRGRRLRQPLPEMLLRQMLLMTVRTMIMSITTTTSTIMTMITSIITTMTTTTTTITSITTTMITIMTMRATITIMTR